MKNKIIYGFIFGILLALLGLFIGINIGGNYYPDFEFMGGRGYEATGYLGLLVGAGIGALLGIFIAQKKSKKL